MPADRGATMRDNEAFRVLGVAPSATRDEIRAAYRRLVKAWHPDRHATSEERRAVAEETVKRVIDAYRAVRSGVAPARNPDSNAPATGTSMFSVNPVAPPVYRARSQPPSPEEIRLRRRQIARRWLPRIAMLAMIVTSSGWWLPMMWNIGIDIGWIDVAALPRLPERMEKILTLTDRVACYSEDANSYELCIRLRLIDYEFGSVLHPRRRPSSFQFVLCAKLQQTYSDAAYSTCVTELQVVQRD
jgi:hypothetical protein